ncbi:putative transcriptional regulator [Nocardia nova SH22a]|uniref:Putative transcriptional regulator n=1 Tax=Nocardia nova SH22a TaxID=1415166 RepID=W5TR57_9NOCA|nr:TetR/AcrR family transcriptional regulator [Nocardia nova]AHH19731.1 putative transcriptional regulator [Nocardia nova SH22a]
MLGPEEPKDVPATLLTAATDTLRYLGPQRFSLTAVAEAAGVSRGTAHNALGTRDNAIATALDHLAAAFTDTVAAAVAQEATLADQVAAAAVLIAAHRRTSGARTPGLEQSVLILLLEHGGERVIGRSLELWKPLVRAARQRGEVGAAVDPARASEWIMRMLFSFELLPPIGIDPDNPRAVRRFVREHIVAGLAGGEHDRVR